MSGEVWSSEQLAAIEAAQEVHFATRRRDGSTRTPRIIWVVTSGGRVFIRSAYGPGADWYRWLLATHSARLDVRQLSYDVSVVEITSEVDNAAVDAAYHDKYGRGYPAIVKDMVKGGPRETTLELLPA